jgi:hypothetical protein
VRTVIWSNIGRVKDTDDAEATLLWTRANPGTSFGEYDIVDWMTNDWMDQSRYPTTIIIFDSCFVLQRRNKRTDFHCLDCVVKAFILLLTLPRKLQQADIDGTRVKEL